MYFYCSYSSYQQTQITKAGFSKKSSVLEISAKGLFPGTVKHIAADILAQFAWRTVYFLLFADVQYSNDGDYIGMFPI